jgi:hypothetical protein
VKPKPDPVGPLVLETVQGFGLFDEDWTLRIGARFPRPRQVPADAAFAWTVTAFTYEIVDSDGPWDDLTILWGRRGPFTLTHLGILRDDATPIDAREIEPIIVPAGRNLDSVTCNIELQLPP